MSASPDISSESSDEEAPVAPYEDTEDNAVTLQMDAPVDDRQWMVQFSAVDRRMLSTDELLAEVHSGRLSDAALVWQNGMPAWAAFSAVEELVQARREAPVAAPPVRSAPAIAPPPPPVKVALPPRVPTAAPALGILASPLAPPPVSSGTTAVGIPAVSARVPVPPPARVPVPPSPLPPRVASSGSGSPSHPLASSGPRSEATTSNGLSNGVMPSGTKESSAPSHAATRPLAGARRTQSDTGAMSLPAFDFAERPERRSEVPEEEDRATAIAPPHQPTTLPRGIFRSVAAQAGVALVALVATSYALSRAGVFDADKLDAERAASGEHLAASASSSPTHGSNAVGSNAVALNAVAAGSANVPAAAATAPSGVASTTLALHAQPTAGEAPSGSAAAPAPSPTPREPALAAKPAAAPDNVEPAAPSAPEPSTHPLTAAERRAQRRAERAERAARSAALRGSRAAGSSPREETPRRRAVESAAEPAADPGNDTAPSDGRGSTFDHSAAQIALAAAADQAKNCRPAGGPTGSGTVQVVYEPSGKVSSALILTPGFENSSAESCITMLFRRARVAPFSGAKSVAVKQRFEIP